VAVLDWLQQLLGGGDPEAAGAAQASTAMQPMTGPWLDKVLSGEMARGGIQDVNDAFASRDPVALAGSFGPSPLGIRAFHGSPHSFDQFDLSKIGTGEGAQAYGHGLYFAESEGVARSYRDNLTQGADPRSFINEIIPWLHQYGGQPPSVPFTKSDIVGQLQRYPETRRVAADDAIVNHIVDAANGYDLKSNTFSPSGLRSLQTIDKTLPPPPKGSMYEVDINAKPEDFLNWDKPLAEQSPQVQSGLDKLRDVYGLRDIPLNLFPGQTPVGRHAYAQIARSSSPNYDIAQKAAAEELGYAGIPGMRYLDQGSRAAGEGSSNYAVWTPEIITILRRYGLLPPLAAGGLLAAPGQGEAAP
jgi:hypothetical protein